MGGRDKTQAGPPPRLPACLPACLPRPNAISCSATLPHAPASHQCTFNKRHATTPHRPRQGRCSPGGTCGRLGTACRPVPAPWCIRCKFA
ncbi:hypothetical protein E2C01_064423 [Portunus trituberculatus]|uniref:Uncharacterized protein n=1 Tax=Portunus trituberculatus TaxID=210409 RepID=A0A5B7HBT8_PORTR|nr:hypothetical protein [Portunus trituberculatus]